MRILYRIEYPKGPSGVGYTTDETLAKKALKIRQTENDHWDAEIWRPYDDDESKPWTTEMKKEFDEIKKLDDGAVALMNGNWITTGANAAIRDYEIKKKAEVDVTGVKAPEDRVGRPPPTYTEPRPSYQGYGWTAHR